MRLRKLAWQDLKLRDWQNLLCLMKLADCKPRKTQLTLLKSKGSKLKKTPQDKLRKIRQRPIRTLLTKPHWIRMLLTELRKRDLKMNDFRLKKTLRNARKLKRKQGKSVNVLRRLQLKQ